VANSASSAVANRPTVVIADWPGGSSDLTEASHRPDDSSTTLPRGWLREEPDRWLRGGLSPRQPRTLGLGVR
jgi:hypothetical protein